MAEETPAHVATHPLPRGVRLIVTVGVMMAVLLQVLDTTIANVALPHMQASLSATQDTINWVLTSYIVASAIALPISCKLSSPAWIGTVPNVPTWPNCWVMPPTDGATYTSSIATICRAMNRRRRHWYTASAPSRAMKSWRSVPAAGRAR